MPHESQADHLNRWDMALTAGEANADEPGVKDLLGELDTAAKGVRVCIGRRNALKSQLQQNSRDLEEFLDNGKDVFSRLMLVVKGRFGPESEKMVEWGRKPRRQPQVTAEEVAKRYLEKVEKEGKKKPPENGVEPTRAANSQTDSAT